MGRILFLIGGSCLLITAVRLTNLQHDNPTLLGSVEPAPAQAKLSPRDAFRQGKELYLRGKYDQALSLLEAATRTTTGLSVADRRLAEDYLGRTRTRLAQKAAGTLGENPVEKLTGAEARGQSPDADPFAVEPTPPEANPVGDATRTRIERLLSQAQAAAKRGEKAEALRLAQQADQVAKGTGYRFGPGELTPQMFLGAPLPTVTAGRVAPGGLLPAGMQPGSAMPNDSRANGASAEGLPDWAGESNSVVNAGGSSATAGRVAKAPAGQVPVGTASGIELTGAVEGGAEASEFVPATSAGSPRAQAQALIAAARADIKAGRLEGARRKALQASELEVSYDLFDDRPELVLSDVDRRLGTVTLAKGPEGRNAAGFDAAFDAPATDSVAPAKSASGTGSAIATTGSRTIPGAGPVSRAVNAANPALATNTGTATATGNAAKNSPTESKKQQAQRLLELARQDLKNGNFEAAKAKALQAQEIDVAYKLFDDRPEVVLNEVAAQMAASNLAKNRPSSSTADPALVATAGTNGADPLAEFGPQPAANTAAVGNGATGSPTPANTAALEPKQQARQLLSQARKALSEGRVDEARQMAIEADRMKAAYDLFDDRPEIVLADIARAAARGPNPSTGDKPVAQAGTPNGVAGAVTAAPAATPATAGQKTPTIAAAAGTGPTNARAEAARMVKEARQLMQAGRLEEARAMAQAADKLNVAFDVFADRPDLVLAEIDRSMQGNIAARSPQGLSPAANPSLASTGSKAAGSPVQTADAQFNPANGAMNVAPAGNVTPAGARPSQLPEFGAELAEVAPSGLSAAEYYRQGMAFLNRGNREAAYQAFLAAHQTGQRLDPLSQQRLQNYLRELAPRNGGKIQLASNQQGKPALAVPGAEEATPLDAMAQQESIKFDRLRTDTLNAVFRAERLRAKDPEGALALIDRQMAAVDGAGLSEDAAANLTRTLTKTRNSLQNEIVRQQPNLDQKRKNEEVLSAIATETENKIRVEQEFAKLVEEFNQLLQQKRFAEAEVISKKAKELDPKNPVAVTMFYKARLGRRINSNEELRLEKEDSFWKQLDDVEQAAIVRVGDDHPMDFGKDWKDITSRRKGKYGPDNRQKSEEELRIEQSLTKRISLHEDNVPLADVMRKIAAIAGINIVFDPLGLEEEGVTSNTPVTIDVDNVMVKSALNLMLQPKHLGYSISDEVLKITSQMRQQGELRVANYPVADLVVPIPSFVPTMANPMNVTGMNPNGGIGAGQMNVPAMGIGGQPFAQVGPDQLGGLSGLPGSNRTGSGPTVDFDTLVELITTTIAPETWAEVGGQATIRQFETTLSLVVRQTQKVHEEIADLLQQLRRLQDLQVTIEVRFVTVSDRFFERIGIDFDFNVQDSIGGPDVDNAARPLQPFGSVQLPQFGQVAQQQGQGQQGQQGQQNQQGQGNFFTPGPNRQLANRDRYPGGTVVGLTQPETFSQDLDIPFRQGSFEVGVPDFGGFNPNAGMQVGLAVLSDIEAFFFIQAAQGDERSNLLFAPKVTLFNGQTASVNSTVSRPFVISLIPTVGFNSTGFQPVIQFIPDGVQLFVQAVISADRRFVRLTVTPFFTNITDVFTFSFVGGGNANVTGGGGGQQLGGGGQGGFGGGGIGGFGGGGQQGFGIGGGMGSTEMVMTSLFAQQNQQGQQGQQNQQGGAGLSVTVQQPVLEVVTVNTTVSVPDGGTVLLGGVKRLREGRNMAGVPILNKIPYVSRLFKNTGVGRETESVMLMVTPRIIIQEEEEELLGLPPE